MASLRPACDHMCPHKPRCGLDQNSQCGGVYVTGPRDRVEALSPGLPEIKEKSGIWNLVPVG